MSRMCPYQKRYVIGPDDDENTMTAACSEVAICSAHHIARGEKVAHSTVLNGEYGGLDGSAERVDFVTAW